MRADTLPERAPTRASLVAFGIVAIVLAVFLGSPGGVAAYVDRATWFSEQTIALQVILVVGAGVRRLRQRNFAHSSG